MYSYIFFHFRSLDGERNSIHKNLVFCLFAAELIFIVGIDRTDDRVSKYVMFISYLFMHKHIFKQKKHKITKILN